MQVPYQDIAGLLVGYVHYFMNDNLKPDDVVQVTLTPTPTLTLTLTTDPDPNPKLNPNPDPNPNPNPNPTPNPTPDPTPTLEQLPVVAKKGGRASADGAAKGNRKRGGRKQRVTETF